MDYLQHAIKLVGENKPSLAHKLYDDHIAIVIHDGRKFIVPLTDLAAIDEEPIDSKPADEMTDEGLIAHANANGIKATNRWKRETILAKLAEVNNG